MVDLSRFELVIYLGLVQYCAALYNSIDSDLDELNYNSVTGHYSYMLKTNIRLSAEVGYDLDSEDIVAGIGFVTGF